MLECAPLKAHAATSKGIRGFWTSLAKQVPGRTDVQCRERWCNVLDPDINQGPFTKQEDQKVASLVAKWVEDNPDKKKVHWGHIAKGMAGRTDSQVKRCWNRLEREELAEKGGRKAKKPPLGKPKKSQKRKDKASS